MDRNLKFAPHVAIRELNLETLSGLVRVVGFARGFQSDAQILELEYDRGTVLVDVKYVHPFWYKPSALFQIIGEAKRQAEGGQWVLKAYLYRNMDGLDHKLYHKVLNLRQQQQCIKHD